MHTDIGAYLKRLRLARGWSQEGLARRAKTSRPEVTKIENNPKPPTDRMLARLVQALEGDVAEAFELAGYGRQRAVLMLDDLGREPRATPDHLRALEDLLRDGGWERDVVRALAVLARATRPAARAAP